MTIPKKQNTLNSRVVLEIGFLSLFEIWNLFFEILPGIIVLLRNIRNYILQFEYLKSMNHVIH